MPMLTIAKSATPFTALVSDAATFALACATPVPGIPAAPLAISTAPTEAEAAAQPLPTATLDALAAAFGAIYPISPPPSTPS